MTDLHRIKSQHQNTQGLLESTLDDTTKRVNSRSSKTNALLMSKRVVGVESNHVVPASYLIATRKGQSGSRVAL